MKRVLRPAYYLLPNQTPRSIIGRIRKAIKARIATFDSPAFSYGEGLRRSEGLRVYTFYMTTPAGVVELARYISGSVVVAITTPEGYPGWPRASMIDRLHITIADDLRFRQNIIAQSPSINTNLIDTPRGI